MTRNKTANNNKSKNQKLPSKGLTEKESPVSGEIMAFAQRLSVLPKRQREKIMDMAEFMISRGG